jgi:hypothetical protein
MNKYVHIVAALSLAPVIAGGADLPRGPYATQSMIERGVVRFSLPDVGTFIIEEIERPPGAAAECHVSLTAVARSLEQAIATGEFQPAVGARKTVWLKKFVFGDDIVCDEAGNECKAKVFMQSVDVAAVEPM